MVEVFGRQRLLSLVLLVVALWVVFYLRGVGRISSGEGPVLRQENEIVIDDGLHLGGAGSPLSGREVVVDGKGVDQGEELSLQLADVDARWLTVDAVSALTEAFVSGVVIVDYKGGGREERAAPRGTARFQLPPGHEVGRITVRADGYAMHRVNFYEQRSDLGEGPILRYFAEMYPSMQVAARVVRFAVGQALGCHPVEVRRLSGGDLSGCVEYHVGYTDVYGRVLFADLAPGVWSVQALDWLQYGRSDAIEVSGVGGGGVEVLDLVVDEVMDAAEYASGGVMFGEPQQETDCILDEWYLVIDGRGAKNVLYSGGRYYVEGYEGEILRAVISRRDGTQVSGAFSIIIGQQAQNVLPSW